ncbi:MAG TPA: hypothetical protein PKC95_00080 [Thauera aminoaromatica]|nr:hypothetical protein [Thauera aminoaromatica]
MTTQAFVGEWFFYRGNGASPEVFTKICNVTDLGGFGAQNALVRATNTCSGGAEEYIPGLSDGQEFTLTTNYEMSDETREAMMDDVDNKATRNFQVRFENGSPSEIYAFACACIGWEMQPSLSDPNRLIFTFKISGAITHP